MMHKMDGSCGPVMTLIGGLTMLVSLGLAGSLIVLTWVAIGRLRSKPASG